MASEVTGEPWILNYFRRQLYEKYIEQDRPLYMVLSISIRHSSQLREPGYDSFEEIWMPRELHNYDRSSTYMMANVRGGREVLISYLVIIYKTILENAVLVRVPIICVLYIKLGSYKINMR